MHTRMVERGRGRGCRGKYNSYTWNASVHLDATYKHVTAAAHGDVPWRRTISDTAATFAFKECVGVCVCVWEGKKNEVTDFPVYPHLNMYVALHCHTVHPIRKVTRVLIRVLSSSQPGAAFTCASGMWGGGCVVAWAEAGTECLHLPCEDECLMSMIWHIDEMFMGRGEGDQMNMPAWTYVYQSICTLFEIGNDKAKKQKKKSNYIVTQPGA